MSNETGGVHTLVFVSCPEHMRGTPRIFKDLYWINFQSSGEITENMWKKHRMQGKLQDAAQTYRKRMWGRRFLSGLSCLGCGIWRVKGSLFCFVEEIRFSLKMCGRRIFFYIHGYPSPPTNLNEWFKQQTVYYLTWGESEYLKPVSHA